MLWALARENLFLVFANNMVQTSLRIRYKHILIFLASLCSWWDWLEYRFVANLILYQADGKNRADSVRHMNYFVDIYL